MKMLYPAPRMYITCEDIITNESLFCHIFAYDIMGYISYYFSKC